jgi:hypothetical protein
MLAAGACRRFMEAEFGDRLNDQGHIKVDEHLLMEGSHNIFAYVFFVLCS